jgi:deazaflavin-dependent oxidoreductase (nitroreductase family)
MKHLGTRIHAAIYQRSRGRILGRVGGLPVLLLSTVGRHSGNPHTTPVQYLRAGKSFAVVAANGGAARPPAWYLNLRANPSVRVQVGAVSSDLRAREVMGDQRTALWRRLTDANRYLEAAADKAGRKLPLLLLEPIRSTTEPETR